MVRLSSRCPLGLRKTFEGVLVAMDKLNPSVPKTSRELVPLLTNNIPEHIDFSIDYLRTLFRNGLDRNTEVERKAALLVGAGGIAAVVFTALAGFLLNFPAMLPDWSRFVVLGFYFLLECAFSVTIFYALKVLWVGSIAYPGASILLEGQYLNSVDYKKLHIADLFIAYSKNNKRIDRDVGNLVKAQRCFLSSIIILIVTSIFIATISLLLD